jgi:GT2 family glycosyltransferase
MKLSIIIVSYNTRQLLENCINSIQRNILDLHYEIIVIDNDSSDGSTDMLLNEHPQVKLIKNNYNAGFAKANNQGFGHSSGEYILLLNSDTIVQYGAVNKLVNFMDNCSEAAICGPKLLNSDLTLQQPCRRGFPGCINSVAHFSGLERLFPKSRLFGSYHMTYMDSGKSHEVDAVSGACLMIRREVIPQIGGLLDEAFFMHFEDIDLCYRVKKKGLMVWYVHDSEIIHLKGQSSKLRSAGVTKNFFDSALVYFRKNYRSENLPGYVFMAVIIKLMRFISLTFIKIKVT